MSDNDRDLLAALDNYREATAKERITDSGPAIMAAARSIVAAGQSLSLDGRISLFAAALREELREAAKVETN